ncbi:DUF7009 family protein [Mucilaginibacter ginkgonis]|uniref:Uncharacterized protein n=1 Tax=Mucilaginibacter ginkgonis TaxID=2682091 RepID=A0A6I4HYM1_9SPHI|nr:hypothetical protein [Mucilaginibacter ginkgonis]QQL51355.1 hypothetical protein GO620_007900 [Mucilaginibacter ginkgonis]
MKVRLKAGSLRYRLTQSDVAKFTKEGVVHEILDFGDDKLTYVLQRTSQPNMFATFKNNIITLFVPEKDADKWTATETVGVEHKGNQLHLLLEKDFTCLENVDEDQSDNYPNPLAKKDHE